MNQVDLYSGGGNFGTSNGAAATFALVPSAIIDPTTGQPYAAVGPVVVTEYLIYQLTGGSAIALLFFDRADVPINGTQLNDASGFKFAAKIGAPDFLKPPDTIHRYDHGLVVVASVQAVQVLAASASTFFSVQYFSYRSG